MLTGLGARARGLARGGAALRGLLLARRGGLLRRGAALLRAAAGAVLELVHEIAEVADGAVRGLRRPGAVGLAQRAGEVAGDALAQPGGVETIEQIGIGFLGSHVLSPARCDG